MQFVVVTIISDLRVARFGESGLKGGTSSIKPNDSSYSVVVKLREISLAVLTLLETDTIRTPSFSAPSLSLSKKPNETTIVEVEREREGGGENVN